MLFNLQKLIRLELKNSYPRLSIVLVELLGILFSLSLYYFTSKAFVPKQDADLNFYGMNYFSFVLIGELGLGLPCYLLSHPALKLNELTTNKLLFVLWTYPKSLWQILCRFTMAGSVLELFRAFTNFAIALFIFELSLSFSQVGLLLLLLLLFSPIFVGLGLVSSALAIYFRKRGGVTAQLMTLSLFLAGAYFPLEVLPEFVKNIGLWLSPFNPMLQLIRESLSGEYSKDIASILSSLILWSVLAPVLGVKMMNWAEQYLKNKGEPLLFTR